MTASFLRPMLITVAGTVALGAGVTAQNVPPPSTAHVTLMAPAALEQLLPSPAGWTRGRVNRDRIDLAETCSYTYADVVYLNAATKVRITIADTGFDEPSLSVLATMVTLFPNNYVGLVDATTTVKRLMFNDSPAAQRWDAQVKEGEFTVVIGKRFVVKAEGTGLDSVDTLRTMVEMIDLKALK